MSATIYAGKLIHTRIAPKRHRFQYPVYTYAFDLDALEETARLSPLFGYNRVRPVSVHDKDYLRHLPGPLAQKARAFLRQHVPGAEEPARVVLVTAARYFNHVFNPVSFYYYYDGDGRVRHVLAEVNNTFGETHAYVLSEPELLEKSHFFRFRREKAFHVSPMFDMEGSYDFYFSPLGAKLDIRMHLIKGDRPAFSAQLLGAGRPFSHQNLLKTLLRYPLTAALTMPRIVWQAAKLHFSKGLPVYDKPIPTHPMTIRTAPPTRRQRWAMTQVLRAFEGLQGGRLELALPDGSCQTFGPDDAPRRQRARVRDYRAFTRLVFGGDVGLGEGYMAGEWEAEDLPGLIAMFLQGMGGLAPPAPALDRLRNWAGRAQARRRRNTLRGSRQNIRAHYDLSNDFYALWLDRHMVYSAAVFAHPEQSLEEAQLHKLDRLIERARVRPEHHVLEIGTGWGALALRLAERAGCRVTSVTISQAQHDWARARVAERGLADRVEIRLQDYRTLQGRFDRIVSVEMIEAVGREYLPAYARALDALLAPDGLVVLQAITLPDARYGWYRRQGLDWMQKHIFPGSHLPSLSALAALLARHTALTIDWAENIGPHYAPTLRAWRQRFWERADAVRALGFDETFLRKWDFYLAYCEAAFETRHLNDLQLVLTREMNPELGLDG